MFHAKATRGTQAPSIGAYGEVNLTRGRYAFYQPEILEWSALACVVLDLNPCR